MNKVSVLMIIWMNLICISLTNLFTFIHSLRGGGGGGGGGGDKYIFHCRIFVNSYTHFVAAESMKGRKEN